MNPTWKNILAVVAGLVVGSIINMALINLGHMIMPIEGLDPDDMEALREIMPTLGAGHFVFPFLAHALGTLAGAAITALIATSHKMRFAIAIGIVFLLGGISAAFMLPAPTWFVMLDLILAYIPMAWIGGKLAEKRSATIIEAA